MSQTFIDPASGRPFMVDPTTGQSRWLEAADPSSQPPPVFSKPMPPGGQPRPKSGRGKKIALWGGGAVIGLMVIGSIASHGSSSTTTTTQASETTASGGTHAAASSAPKAAASSAPKPDIAVSAAPKVVGTVSQRNALRTAQNYIEMKGFSKKGLIVQLSSDYGEKFSKADATWAVAHLDVDWNKQAVRAGQAYLDMKGFSRAGLIDQLSSAYGDQFTKAQATYAADKLGLK